MRVWLLKQELPPSRARVFRLFSPLLLIPLGMLYCHVRGFFEEGRWSPLLDSMGWAGATLLPWSAAIALFLALVAPHDPRARAMRWASVLAPGAYVLSGVAALLVGSDLAGAFYTRMPALAVALLAAALYGNGAPPRPARQVRAAEGAVPLAPADIVFASAAGNYVELHGANRSIVWRQTMHNAERILAPAGFVRVHRRYLVPRRSIEMVQRDRKGPVEVALHNGRRIPVSHLYAANLHDG